MGRNMKKDKKQRNEAATKVIKQKQSQKKKEQKRIERIRNIRKNEKQLREEKTRKEQQNQSQIQTKKQERIKFIQLIGKAGWYEKRVDAEIADQKRKEAYLRYVDYQPKLEEKVYRSKEWEGKGDR